MIEEDPPEPLVKDIERILDDCSAWIARPNPEVTTRIAIAAFMKAQAALAQSNPEPTHRDMAYFGASEAACYYYPGEDEQLLRDAYCRGAAEYAPKPFDAEPPKEIYDKVKGHAVTQSNPEPVAWRWRYKWEPDNWHYVANEFTPNETQIMESLYTAPPRPDLPEWQDPPSWINGPTKVQAASPAAAKALREFK